LTIAKPANPAKNQPTPTKELNKMINDIVVSGINRDKPLSPLAKAFNDALMSVDFKCDDDESVITQSIARAIREYYATIECDPRYLAMQIIENM
jgi:hypothetical protein